MTPKQKKQSEDELNRAHQSYEKGMNSYVYFKIHNHETGQDLVQDTFIKTWRYLVKGGKIELMKPFLYHVLNHLIVDEYRKRKNTSLDSLLEKGYEPKVDPSERLFNIIDGKSAMLLVKNLPLKYQNIIKMRYNQGLSLKEISIITGQTRNAVAVQVHRGIAKLRKLYKAT